MEWFTANWFWALIFAAFIAMHMFGHGGHGGHSGHGDIALNNHEADRSTSNAEYQNR